MEPFWTSVREATLQQGDMLPGCWIPEYPEHFSQAFARSFMRVGLPSSVPEF